LKGEIPHWPTGSEVIVGIFGSILILVLIRFTFPMGLDDRPWVTKDPSAWTLQDAEMVLWNSPWAKSTSYRFFGSRGAIWKFTFYVRLQSARPVRLALARAFEMQQADHYVIRADHSGTPIEELAERIQIPDEMVFSLIAFPPFIHNQLDDQSIEELRKKTYVLVGKSEKIGLKDYVPPKESSFGEAWFRFPRPKASSDFQEIRFVTTLEVRRKVSIKVAFDVSELEFGNQLEY